MGEYNDIMGLNEIKGMTTKEILLTFIRYKEEMDYYFESCSVESGLRDFFDNRQMGKDIWLYSFYKLIETSSLEKDEKIKLLQLLMDIFGIDNKMSAERHYYEMENNIEYRVYMRHCFDVENNGRAAFWILNGFMSNDGRIIRTIGYSKDYIKFMGQLEVYLSKMFKGRGFGYSIDRFLSRLLSYLAENIEDNTALTDVRLLVNPAIREV